MARGSPWREEMPFLTWGDRTFSFGTAGSLLQRACRQVRAMSRPGDTVLLTGCSPVQAIVVSAAVRLAGRRPLVSEHGLNPAAQAGLNELEPGKGLLSIGQPGVGAEVSSLVDLDLPADPASSEPRRAVLEDWLQGEQWCLTSGTSGAPKAVLHRIAVACRNAEAHLASIEAPSPRRILSFLPMSYSFQCLTTVLSALVSGSELILLPSTDPQGIRRALFERGPEIVSFTPYVFRSFVRMFGLDPLVAAGRVTVGGAPVGSETLAMLREIQGRGTPTFVTYGATEFGPRITTHRVTQASHRAGEVGRPIGGVEVGVREADGRVLVRSPFMAARTAPSIAGSLASDADGFVSTNDLGFMMEGSLVLRGRADSVIVFKDTKVDIGLLEDIAEHESDVLAAAVTVEASQGVQRIVCRVNVGIAAEPEAVEARLRLAFKKKLPPSSVPSTVEVTSEPLVTASGKRRRVRGRANSGG